MDHCKTVNTLQKADHLITQLVNESFRHRATQHPYLEAIGNGSLPDPQAALRDFADHYYGYSCHFPRYLTAVISRLDNPQHRRNLLDNLTEESGTYDDDDLAVLQREGIEPEWINGIPHPILFERFRSALGLQEATKENDHIEVIC